jgi:hypothetical protein
MQVGALPIVYIYTRGHSLGYERNQKQEVVKTKPLSRAPLDGKVMSSRGLVLLDPESTRWAWRIDEDGEMMRIPEKVRQLMPGSEWSED